MATRIFQAGGETDSFFNDYASMIIDSNSQPAPQEQETPQEEQAPEEESDYIKNLREFDAEKTKEDDFNSRMDEYIKKIDEHVANLYANGIEANIFDENDPEEMAAGYDTRNGFNSPFNRSSSSAGTYKVNGNSSQNESSTYNFFINKGYSKEAAAGIAANLKHESNFNVNAVGDGGKARGYAQWHPNRYGPLSQKFDLSTHEGNLNAIDYELHNSESGALAALNQARTPEEAAKIFDQKYERSAGLSTSQRMQSARNIYSN